MSDTWLIVIPDDPYWRPDRAAADRAAAALAGMLSAEARRGLEARWHDTVEVVLCYANLEKISCPGCGAELYSGGWWGEAVTKSFEEGFATLEVAVPCCGAATSLNDLVYDWPMGFASFRIEVLYPERGWLTDGELTEVAEALGHPVRQILAHL
ncbi:hypothetical protein ABZ915_30665 [Streptomyces sp. NPDC046915]|uniref:hypothetical protein n=1 Tax=Streptomyces sp. NPDC046915 TaxID=3155257 RepID=UPI00340C3625